MIRGGRWFNSIGRRLFAGYLGVIVLLIVAWAAGTYAVRISRDSYSRSVNTLDALTTSVVLRIKLLDDQETGLRGYLLTGKPLFLKPYDDATVAWPAARARSDQLAQGEPGARVFLDTMGMRALAWQAWAGATLAAPAHGKAAVVAQQETGRALFDRYRLAAASATTYLDAARQRALRDSQDILNRVQILFAVIFAGALALMALIGWRTTRAVIDPLTRLGQAAGRVGAGDLDRAVSATGTIEFVALARSMDNMRAQLQAMVGALHGSNSALTQRTEELAAANQELEAFSYSVSHDLRSPLRAMDGFSRILLEDYAEHLPPDGRRYLQYVRDGALRMGTLIDDLLTFSRLGRQPLNTQTVDMAALVQQVLAELPREEGRQLELVIGALPPAEADPSLLRQVLINLLGNALKFTRGTVGARVEVSACNGDEGVVYSIKDNGAGFDMRYAGKLFGVFQRLHRAEEYEGTGVGLAIVQQVIHRHGGRIWAEAAVGQGATFYFTLKGAPADG